MTISIYIMRKWSNFRNLPVCWVAGVKSQVCVVCQVAPQSTSYCSTLQLVSLKKFSPTHKKSETESELNIMNIRLKIVWQLSSIAAELQSNFEARYQVPSIMNVSKFCISCHFYINLVRAKVDPDLRATTIPPRQVSWQDNPSFVFSGIASQQTP